MFPRTREICGLFHSTLKAMCIDNPDINCCRGREILSSTAIRAIGNHLSTGVQGQNQVL